MVYDLVIEWLGLSDFITMYPAYTPFVMAIVGMFSILVTHIFWCVLSSIFGMFEKR